MNKIISKKEAKERGFKTYFTGIPCINKHIDVRYVSTNGCKSCNKISKKKSRAGGKSLADRRYNLKLSRGVHPNAIPRWSDEREINNIFKIRGHDEEVDHIIPLKSNLVCGLHVANNLRLVNKKFNNFKSNCMWPDMPRYSYHDLEELYGLWKDVS